MTTILSTAGTKPVKPVHGVGQPPLLGCDCSMFHYLTEAGIPFSRLHDVGGVYGENRFVDIPNLFRDFDADAEDPASYDFAFTDHLIKALMEAKVEPVFRLGVTIENDIHIKSYRLDPPKDPHKWARICEGVIAHYTEGWADGFHYPIRYWEIWNEPDNEVEPEKNQMWNGTAEQYYELYAVTSRHLKARFPHLKIGGYASCGFYDLKKSYVPEAASSPRFEYFISFFDGFLRHVKEQDCPLDFFSWHSYDSPENNLVYAQYARDRLDEAGFSHTETTCNEWNYQSRCRGTARHAALTAAMLLTFQKSPLDNAMFYDARIGVSRFGSLFHPMTTKPLKAYYAFCAFNRLYQLGTEDPVEAALPAGVYACGAHKGKERALMLVNTTTEDLPIALEQAPAKVLLVDESHDYTPAEFSGVLPKESVMLVEFASPS